MVTVVDAATLCTEVDRCVSIRLQSNYTNKKELHWIIVSQCLSALRVTNLLWVFREIISRRYRLLTTSRYSKTCVKGVFLENVITCPDIVAMSAWPSIYKKKWQKIDNRGFQPLNEKLSDQPNKIIAFRRSYRTAGKIFSIWGILPKPQKISYLQRHENYLECTVHNNHKSSNGAKLGLNVRKFV